MAIKKVFKSYIPSINYVTQRGRTCIFQEGKYLTEVPEEIAELTDVCNSKSNPHIYIDPNEQEIDTTVQERIRAAAQKAALEEMEKIAQEKSQVGKNGEESNTQAKDQVLGSGQSMSAATMLGVANTATMNKGMMANSNGSPVAVK